MIPVRSFVLCAIPSGRRLRFLSSNLEPPTLYTPPITLKLVRIALKIAAIAAVAAALAPAPAPARAQQPASPSLTINQIDASAFPDINVVVTALDARGVPARGLNAAQFQAFDNNTPLTISSAQAAQDQELRLATVIVIDISGSMAGDPLDRAKQSATEFVRSLSPNDEAAVISFNDKVTPVVALTNDRQKLTSGIAGLEAGGGTALFEAVQTSAFIAGSSNAPRSAVIFLTDGENDTQTSEATSDGSLAAALGAGVPIFTVGFGATPDTRYLQGLATTTQGQYRAATAGTIASAYADIATLLRNQYVVTVRGLGAADGNDASLQIIAFIGDTPAASVATYKRGTAPPPVVAPQPTAAQAATPGPPGKKSDLPANAFGAAVLLVGAAIMAWLLVRWQRRRSLRLAQMKIVEPNIRQAAARPLIRGFGGVAATAAAPAAAGTGRLREKGGAGHVFELGAGPSVIGTSPRTCTIVLPPSESIAAEHARIWLRDGRYLLHHVGGMSRKTYIAGREADWVVLEPGDELTIGPHQLLFEDPG